jgi:hypothetical protein
MKCHVYYNGKNYIRPMWKAIKWMEEDDSLYRTEARISLCPEKRQQSCNLCFGNDKQTGVSTNEAGGVL